MIIKLFIILSRLLLVLCTILTLIIISPILVVFYLLIKLNNYETYID